MNLDERYLDAIGELINIGIGNAAAILNDMVESHVTLRVPEVRVVTAGEFPEAMARYGDGPLSSVSMRFTGGMNGSASLIFPEASATQLVALLTGESVESPDVQALKGETLNEVGNIVINGVLGSLANMLERHLDYRPPLYDERPVADLAPLQGEAWTVVLAFATFSVDVHRISGEIMLLFEVGGVESFLQAIDRAK